MPSALERFMMEERQTGRKEGRKEGKREGLKVGRLIIKNMQKKNFTIQQIIDITGLTEKEIKECQESE